MFRNSKIIDLFLLCNNLWIFSYIICCSYNVILSQSFQRISNQVSSPPSGSIAIIISIINYVGDNSLSITMRCVKRIIIFIPCIRSLANTLFSFSFNNRNTFFLLNVIFISKLLDQTESILITLISSNFSLGTRRL